MKILRNAAQCLGCNDVIVSKHRHDFRTCKCGKLSVDGGLEYIRRSGTLALCMERCAYEYGTHSRDGEASGKWLVWSPGGKTNPQMIFDHPSDAEDAAKELAARVPPSHWYVAELSAVPIEKK